MYLWHFLLNIGVFTYTTNNPQYLEYVARHLSRREIEAHPQLCQWLNNPYVKDNMELAIRYAEAEGGTFDDKKNFVEYFMCNGPELEANTLLYYREKILIDPEYRQIGFTFYSDIDKVVEIRSNLYGKSNLTTSSDRHGKNYDWFNCFKNPCNYLGPFSARQGHLGDVALVSSTPNNVLAERRFALGLAGGSAFAQGPNGKPQTDDQQAVSGTIPSAEGASGSTPADVKGGPLPRWLVNQFPPAQQLEYAKYVESRNQQTKDEVKKLVDAGKLNMTQVGDPHVVTMAEAMKILVKGNTRRFLGDCSKLWSHVRNYNPFDPTMNKQKPITSAEVVGNTAPNGQPATINDNAQPIDAAPKQEAIAALLNQGHYSVYLNKFASEEVKNWTKEQFYQALIDELNSSKTDWNGKLCEYIAGFLLKSGKKLKTTNTKEAFSGLITLLRQAEQNGKTKEEILSQHGIRI